MIELNSLLAGFLLIYAAQCLLSVVMELINVAHMERTGSTVPLGFEDFLDSGKLRKMTAYMQANSRLEIAESITGDVVLLTIILSGLLQAVEGFLSTRGVGQAASSLLFFLTPGAILFFIQLPFSYCHSFVIEERFGFNRSTVRTWILDHLKSIIISTLLFSVILVSLMWLIRISPERWWLLGFLLVSLIQIFLVAVYPLLIAPLFNRFEPIKDELLGRKIHRLMEQNGLRVKKILQMDAGMRSRHTNAYFTGFGRTKQIVLYDTLIESHTHGEILAVLAHELGHFKRGHIIKQLLLGEFLLLAGFYFTGLLIGWESLYSAFGFTSAKPYVGLFLISILWQKAGFFVQPLFMMISRRYEKEADLFAARLLGTPHPLSCALKRMAVDNLANLSPHPFYVWFNYSHPPLVDRVRELEQLNHDDQNSGGSSGESKEVAQCSEQ